jgi:hypothetical protein
VTEVCRYRSHGSTSLADSNAKSWAAWPFMLPLKGFVYKKSTIKVARNQYEYEQRVSVTFPNDAIG